MVIVVMSWIPVHHQAEENEMRCAEWQMMDAMS